MQKTAIITGITGQDGAYLSQLLLEKNYKVVGLIRKDSEENFFGVEYLGIKDRIVFEKCNLLDFSEVRDILTKFKPDEIYNLAAQSSVGCSFEKPMETINFNISSVLNFLEAIKNVDKNIKFYQASSSDMFGNIDRLPVTEDSVIHPTSPYAISKVTGHWMTINYRESYGMFACCGILFNHESYLRADNFFVKKVIKIAIDIKNGKQSELKVGNIDLSRDFGYAPDYVRAMWLMLQQDEAKDFIICSGKSVSLREIVEYVFDKLKIDKNKIMVDKIFFRPNDIQNIYGSNERAKAELGWKYDRSFFEVLDNLIEEEHNNLSIKK
ncbi:MAG: GDP-mannose 4,6-dehydratase [Candidatus Moranbacteria bacterium GW2011_GWA2_39_41]|nr:MAG: GDP-mannose 4,6-dehydratase [Candidatus Moranbacteria bacterium GW2011_GWA2_39_41]